jgi:hypothetical protein
MPMTGTTALQREEEFPATGNKEAEKKTLYQ